MRSDMVLYSECERIIYYIELRIPFEDAIEEAFVGWHAIIWDWCLDNYAVHIKDIHVKS